MRSIYLGITELKQPISKMAATCALVHLNHVALSQQLTHESCAASSPQPNDVVIIRAVRTPIGGKLAEYFGK